MTYHMVSTTVTKKSYPKIPKKKNIILKIFQYSVFVMGLQLIV